MRIRELGKEEPGRERKVDEDKGDYEGREGWTRAVGGGGTATRRG